MIADLDWQLDRDKSWPRISDRNPFGAVKIDRLQPVWQLFANLSDAQRLNANKFDSDDFSFCVNVNGKHGVSPIIR